jgi:VanZ family protein
MERIRYLAVYWLPVIIYCLLIFIQSSLPSPEELSKYPHTDKLFHFIEYAVLGALFLRAFRTLPFKGKKRSLLLLSIATSILYGLSDELHQYFIPYRDASLMDIAADSAGSICGVVFSSRRL